MISAIQCGPAGSNRAYAAGLARAFGGAIVFSLPLLMTMEMWHIGFYIDSGRLLLFLSLNLLLLVGLSRFVGFEETSSLADDVLDALAGFGVGIVATAAILAVFGVLRADMRPGEIAGMIALQSIPASFGAVIARQQLSGSSEDRHQRRVQEEAGYAGQLFLMLAGALFLAFNVAPTEEMILIAFQMTPLHAIALILLSIAALHMFVYAVGFAGQEEGEGFARTFLSYTLAGYGIAILVSLYVLWTFGRTDGTGLPLIATMCAVLGFPAAIGAAIARLVV